MPVLAHGLWPSCSQPAVPLYLTSSRPPKHGTARSRKISDLATMSGHRAGRADLDEKPPTITSSFRLPDDEEEDDVEAQHSVATESDGSGDSNEIPVEGGMTVAFKVGHSRQLSSYCQPASRPRPAVRGRLSDSSVVSVW